MFLFRTPTLTLTLTLGGPQSNLQIVQGDISPPRSDSPMGPFGQSGALVQGSNFSGGNIVGGGVKIIGGMIPGGILSGDNIHGSNIPGGNISGGNIPGGNIPRGNIPGGNIPGANLSGLNTAADSSQSLQGLLPYPLAVTSEVSPNLNSNPNPLCFLTYFYRRP
jgi:uncharacterized protein YjbI with pentapeptide repeats